MSRQLAIRFDVDTHRCVRAGMPALSRLGERLGAPFTFFVNMGRAVSRGALVTGLFGHPGDRERRGRPVAAKLSARRKLGTAGWLEAAFLNPRVGAARPEVLRKALRAGHEIGLHGGRNHAEWQAEAHTWPAERVGAEIDAVLPVLRDALDGAAVPGFASPGWNTHPELPGLLATRGFEYLADLHGPATDREADAPLPLLRTQLTGEPGGVAYIEHLRALGLDDDEVVARARRDLAEGGERMALYDHPYHAGLHELATLERIIELARELGYRIVPMGELARSPRVG